MDINTLITSLERYGDTFPLEKHISGRMTDFIRKHREFAFVKENLAGHVTASLWVINPEKTKVHVKSDEL